MSMLTQKQAAEMYVLPFIYSRNGEYFSRACVAGFLKEQGFERAFHAYITEAGLVGYI